VFLKSKERSPNKGEERKKKILILLMQGFFICLFDTGYKSTKEQTVIFTIGLGQVK
jgi:hypothetical protein